MVSLTFLCVPHKITPLTKLSNSVGSPSFSHFGNEEVPNFPFLLSHQGSLIPLDTHKILFIVDTGTLLLASGTVGCLVVPSLLPLFTESEIPIWVDLCSSVLRVHYVKYGKWEAPCPVPPPPTSFLDLPI